MATYKKSFQLQGDDWRDDKIWLDLGEVGVLAEVIINGQHLGTLWKTPYKMEVSNALRKGSNEIEIRVANLWVNRIIGDKVLGESYTFPAFDFYTAESALLPSGLIGPVRLVRQR